MNPTAAPVLLDLPFRGRWLARNSPARRVPSHGTDLFGTTHAIDFIGVDDRGRSAPWTWRAVLTVESPDGFTGFGRPVLAPIAGSVVIAHDGEPDHVGRRSQIALLPYALGQARRARAGGGAVAGNHVVIAVEKTGPFVLLAHLKQGTIGVRVGDAVTVGEQVGECGNSGNSTRPHVHVQVTATTQWPTARGLPMLFRRSGRPPWMPAESEIVDGG